MRRFLKSHAEAIYFFALLICIYVVLIPAMDAHEVAVKQSASR